MATRKEKKNPEPVIPLGAFFDGSFAAALSVDKKRQKQEMTKAPEALDISSAPFGDDELKHACEMATRIMSKLRPSDHGQKDLSGVSDMKAFQAAGARALEYGNWWHESMQFLPWKSGPEQIARYRDERLALLEGKTLEVRGAREWMLLEQSNLFGELTAPDSLVTAEIPFCRLLGESSFQDGVIDLLWIAPGGQVHVIDWKTDSFGGQKPDEATVQKAADGYKSQLVAYREAIEGHRLQVDSVSLWFTAIGKLHAQKK